jgi:hypothetical protein
LANRLQRKFKNSERGAWQRIAKTEIDNSYNNFKIDKEIAQVVAIFVAMLVRKYYIGV